MEKIIRCYKPGGITEDLTAVIPFDELRKRIGGYVEIHNVGGVTVTCDEDGKFKQLPFCRNIQGSNYVGDLYVGNFTGAGLEPVPAKSIELFERKHMFRL